MARRPCGSSPIRMITILSPQLPVIVCIHMYNRAFRRKITIRTVPITIVATT